LLQAMKNVQIVITKVATMPNHVNLVFITIKNL